MSNKYVDFVLDSHFKKCVRHVCDSYKEAKILEDKELQKNGIDPIKMTFDMIDKKMEFAEWKVKESSRQKDKTVNNSIGDFHQMLLGGVKGWTDLGVGDDTKLDLKKDDNTVFMELKNRQNTVNSDSAKQVRDKLEKQSKQYPKAKCYFAYLIAKNGKSEIKDWKKRDKKDNSNVKRISGSKIYEIITGDATSLENTWRALPLAINDVCGKKHEFSDEYQKTFDEWFLLAFSRK